MILHQHRGDRVDLGAEVEQLERAERLATRPGVHLVAIDVGEARHRRVGLDVRPGERQGLRPIELGVDRKSTRLNSSHSQISYAVFCLKKKKQKLHGHDRTAYIRSL